MGSPKDNSVKAQKLANESAEKQTAMQIAQQQKTNEMYQNMFNNQMQYAKDQDTLNEQAKLQNQAKLNPYVDSGTSALKDYQNAISDQNSWYNQQFTGEDLLKDPSYLNRLQTGQNSLDNSLAAKNGLLSGAALKATTQYNQNFASNEYQNAWSRDQQEKNNRLNGYANLVNTGYNATNAWTGQNQASQLNNVMSNLLTNYTNQQVNSDSSYTDALTGITANNYNSQIGALQGARGGNAMGGALSGAAAGASVGTAIMPGWGTAIGAGVGAIGGAFASRG